MILEYRVEHVVNPLENLQLNFPVLNFSMHLLEGRESWEERVEGGRGRQGEEVGKGWEGHRALRGQESRITD
jgi:hypothetical protein